MKNDERKWFDMLTAGQEQFLIGCLIFLGLIAFGIFIRIIKGPRVVDRIMGVNMMGTITMCALAIIAVMKQESYLVDICIIYAVISFLAVVVLCKVYMGVYKQQHLQSEKGKEVDKK